MPLVSYLTFDNVLKLIYPTFETVFSFAKISMEL